MYYLLGKDDCELCDKAEQLLVSLASAPKFIKINILDDKRLEQRYSWHIPVLLAIDCESLDVIAKGKISQFASCVADRIEQILPSDTTFNADSKAHIRALLDNEARSIELFWPFPVSRLKEFVSR